MTAAGSGGEHVARLQAERLRSHRLEPSLPITDEPAAAAFVRDRLVVMNTGGSSIAVMAWAIAGRRLAGSWMSHPEANQIYDLLGSLGPPAFFPVRLIDGKYATVTPDVASVVHRYASDPDRVQQAEAELTSDQAALLAAVRADGEVRMDQWPGKASQRNAVRRALDRRLLVVTEEVHAEHSGVHVAVVRPWSWGAIAAAGVREPHAIAFDEAVDALVRTGLHSAAVSPVKDVGTWFPESAAGLARLIEQGEATEVADDDASRYVTLQPAD